MSNITYTSVQTCIDFNTDLSFGARTTFRALASHLHNGKITCYPSLKRIGAMIGRSVRSVIRYVKELVEAGLVSKIRRGYKTNLYTVHKHIAVDPNTKKMIELNENNPERNLTVGQADNKNNLIDKNIKNNNYKSWVGRKSKAKKIKDEYTASNLDLVNKLRQQSLGLNNEQFEKLLETEKGSVTTNY